MNGVKENNVINSYFGDGLVKQLAHSITAAHSAAIAGAAIAAAQKGVQCACQLYTTVAIFILVKHPRSKLIFLPEGAFLIRYSYCC